MKMHIREFAELTGVSVRTLHYYDEIGLLKPAIVDKATGYRYYDEGSLMQMQQILFYRELDFPLKDIRHILASPNYDKRQALTQQKQLLQLKKERLERLIRAVDNAMKGEITMDAFRNDEINKYRDEVKQRWGHTEAYAEHQERNKNQSRDTQAAKAAALDAVFARFARCRSEGNSPDSDAAKALVQALQDCITANYYTCTRQVLAGLGQMYTADERFRQNIDKHGEGTAQFVSDAIANYCK